MLFLLYAVARVCCIMSSKRTSWTLSEMLSVVNLAAERHSVYLVSTAYNHRQMIGSGQWPTECAATRIRRGLQMRCLQNISTMSW